MEGRGHQLNFLRLEFRDGAMRKSQFLPAFWRQTLRYDQHIDVGSNVSGGKAALSTCESTNQKLSRENLLDDMTVNVGEAAFQPIMVKRQAFVIEAHQVK